VQRRIDRSANHSSEQRRFLNLQVGDGLSKIKLRGGCEAIVAMRQIHLVGVHRKDLRFRVTPLDLQRQQNLLHLAAEADLAAVQEEIARKLHADRAGALRLATMQNLSPRGSRDAWKVDAPMLFKMLIFDRRNRVVENFGTLLVSHQDATLQRKAADKLPVIGINFGNNCGAIRLERPNFGQVAGVDKQQPASRAKRNRAKQQKCQRHTVNQLPTA
jgi:hypothetical protein